MRTLSLRFRLAFLLFGNFCLFSSVSLAEIWQPAPVLKKETLSLGVASKIYLPIAVNGFVTAAYGLDDSWQFEGRFGLGTTDTYYGFFTKYQITLGKLVDLAAWGGVHNQREIYIDTSIIASRRFGLIQFYFAPLFLSKLSNSLGLAIAYCPGIVLPIGNFNTFGEVTINGGNYYSAVSGGIKWVF